MLPMQSALQSVQMAVLLAPASASLLLNCLAGSQTWDSAPHQLAAIISQTDQQQQWQKHQQQQQHQSEQGEQQLEEQPSCTVQHLDALPPWLAELSGLTASDVLLLACLRPGLSPQQEESLAQLMAAATLKSRSVWEHGEASQAMGCLILGSCFGHRHSYAQQHGFRHVCGSGRLDVGASPNGCLYFLFCKMSTVHKLWMEMDTSSLSNLH